MEKIRLSPAQIVMIERTLSEGDRVELVPVKDGIKALRVKRKEIKENTSSPA